MDTTIQTIIKNVNYSNTELIGTDFSNATFINCKFDNSDLSNVKFNKSVFKNCSFINAKLINTDFSDADLRGCTLKNANVTSANFYYALLEQTNLENVIYDNSTKFFGNSCKKEGYIIGYKKCFNYRIVKLLIPKDAKRSSATNEACRCEKARVLSITNLDETKSYQDAFSLNDANLIYRVNEMVYPDSYNDDPWIESTHGIHFFSTRQQAIDY